MTRKRIIIGLVGLATLLPQILGCIGPVCDVAVTDVWLTSESPRAAVGSLTVDLVAETSVGGGGCGDDPPPAATAIVEYRWDLDGDGVFEIVGLESEQTVTFDEPGEHTVMVEVEDDVGATAQSSLTFETLAAADPAVALERARVFVSGGGWSGRPCPESRNVCVTVSSDLPVEFDADVYVTQDDGTEIAESFETSAGISAPDASLCFAASLAAGQIDVVLASGEATVTRTLDLPVADVAAECLP